MGFVLDIFPAVLFAAAYFLGGHDIYLATAVLIPSCIGLAALLWVRRRRMPVMQVGIAVLVTVFGGLTLALHDPAFLKIKLTIFYGTLALILLGSQFIGDKVLLAKLPQQVLVMPDGLWRRVNFAWVVFFAFCAALNLYVATHFSETVWVNMKLYGFTALTFVFLLAHLPFVSKYVVEEEPAKPSA